MDSFDVLCTLGKVPIRSGDLTMADCNINQKRQKYEEEDHGQLIPGLPDHLAQLCLSLVPPKLLYSVCHSWRRVIYSPTFPPFLSIYALLSFSDSSASVNTSKPHIAFFSYDPIAATWNPLPTPSPSPLCGLLLHHPSFLFHRLPVQSIAISGHLLILAATTHRLLPALTRPLIFHPLSNQWKHGPPMRTPRRWCAVGSILRAVYVMSGIGAEYSPEVARSGERWDLKKESGWEKIAPLKDGRFSREAVDAVGLRGKLCMVNVKGNAAKDGAVYNVENDEWEEMPKGLLSGWKGPAAALEEKVMYTVLDNGVLMEYNPNGDCWLEVIWSEHLKGATQVAAGGGRVCAVCAGGMHIAVVDVVSKPARIWVVNSPPTTNVVTVHVLPRMSKTAPAEP